MPFGRAVALFVHEHSHIMGWDGHRGFSDHLTELLEQVILQRDLFDLLEQEWRDIVSRVQASRSNNGSDIATAAKKLKKLPAAAIEEWLSTLPVEVLSNVPTNFPRKEPSCDS